MRLQKRKEMNTRLNNSHGFTILEVIVVMILMAIMAAVAVSRMSDNTAELIGRVAVIKSHLRYTQSRAMNSNSVWGIRIGDNLISYFLFRYVEGQTLQESRVLLPGQDSLTVTLPSGMSMAVSPNSSYRTISFDSWGRPCRDEAGTIFQSGTRTITITFKGSSESISITENTGFIP